jgi:hypothetical protein
VGKRVGGSAYWRIGVWEVRLLFDPHESRYGRFETTVYSKRLFWTAAALQMYAGRRLGQSQYREQLIATGYLVSR